MDMPMQVDFTPSPDGDLVPAVAPRVSGSVERGAHQVDEVVAVEALLAPLACSRARLEALDRIPAALDVR
jgi:hypothetical protein